MGDDSLEIEFSRNEGTFQGNTTNKHYVPCLGLQNLINKFSMLISEKFELGSKMLMLSLISTN